MAMDSVDIKIFLRRGQENIFVSYQAIFLEIFLLLSFDDVHWALFKVEYYLVLVSMNIGYLHACIKSIM